MRFEAILLLILPPSLRVFRHYLVDELELLVLGTLRVKTILFLQVLWNLLHNWLLLLLLCTLLRVG